MMDQTPADDWDDVDRMMLRDDAVQEAFGARASSKALARALFRLARHPRLRFDDAPGENRHPSELPPFAVETRGVRLRAVRAGAQFVPVLEALDGAAHLAGRRRGGRRPAGVARRRAHRVPARRLVRPAQGDRRRARRARGAPRKTTRAPSVRAIARVAPFLTGRPAQGARRRRRGARGAGRARGVARRRAAGAAGVRRPRDRRVRAVQRARRGDRRARAASCAGRPRSRAASRAVSSKPASCRAAATRSRCTTPTARPRSCARRGRRGTTSRSASTNRSPRSPATARSTSSVSATRGRAGRLVRARRRGVRRRRRAAHARRAARAARREGPLRGSARQARRHRRPALAPEPALGAHRPPPHRPRRRWSRCATSCTKRSATSRCPEEVERIRERLRNFGGIEEVEPPDVARARAARLSAPRFGFLVVLVVVPFRRDSRRRHGRGQERLPFTCA